VEKFWEEVSSVLSGVLDMTIPCSPKLLSLNDNSPRIMSLQKRRIMLSGLTAAQKILALRWQPPHSLAMSHWIRPFVDIIYLQLSTARIHGAIAKQQLTAGYLQLKPLNYYSAYISQQIACYLFIFGLMCKSVPR
jgi:hypothetical protein